MMKRILAIFMVFIVAGCAPSNSQWDNSGYSQAAQTAPSQLTREALREGSVYTPHQSPAEQQQQAQANMPQVEHQGLSYDDFQAHRRAVEEQQAAMPSAPAPAPVQSGPALPPVNVALLLPLSGEHADLGQSMLQAAQLALFDMGYKAFELMPRDTRGTPQGAAQAAQSAINDGAQLILGPLFATSVSAVKPIAGRYGINTVAFSTDWSLAGGNTYIMGFLPFAQVQRVSEYAAQNGYTDIGILAPNTDYGNAVIAAYNSLAYRTGLSTAEVVKFSNDESETSTILRNFTKYDRRVQALKEEEMRAESSGDKAMLAQLKKMDTYGALPFQAVLMPTGGDQARSVANMLSFYDLGPEQVRRLGTGLWDDPGLATEPALAGAWFAAPDPNLRADFERRYRELYTLRPPRLATLAYDATALAAVLAKKSYQQRGQVSFEKQDLMNPNGFAGIDGIFRFRPDGLIERGLAVLEYRDASIRVVDPAPTTFQRATY